MKKAFLFLMLVAVSGFSQKLTMKELIEWQPAAHSEIKQHFLDSGWKLTDEHISKQPVFGDIFLVSTQKPEPSTIHLQILHEMNDNSRNRLDLKMKSKEQFDALKSELEILGFKFVSRQTAQDKSVVTFENENLTILAIAYKWVGSPPGYGFLITNKKYTRNLYNFAEGK
jgi:hypothetical protein